MPARYDYGRSRAQISSVPNLSGIGHWHDGVFEFAPGHSLSDDKFVCPYGDHLVEIDNDWEGEDNFYEGYCDVCKIDVEIDYEPSAVIWRAS